jgi:hypothetical protein
MSRSTDWIRIHILDALESNVAEMQYRSTDSTFTNPIMKKK